MVRAILRNGRIQPLSPLPIDWSEGQELFVEDAGIPGEPEDLEAWSREIDELAARIPADDFDRLEAELAMADRQAKESVRRQMGLP